MFFFGVSVLLTSEFLFPWSTIGRDGMTVGVMGSVVRSVRRIPVSSFKRETPSDKRRARASNVQRPETRARFEFDWLREITWQIRRKRLTACIKVLVRCNWHLTSDLRRSAGTLKHDVEILAEEASSSVNSINGVAFLYICNGTLWVFYDEVLKRLIPNDKITKTLLSWSLIKAKGAREQFQTAMYVFLSKDYH